MLGQTDRHDSEQRRRIVQLPLQGETTSGRARMIEKWVK
jgi:hypothetical protein